MSNNHRPPTMKEKMARGGGSDVGHDGSFKLRPGIRNFLIFVLAWSVLSNFLMITGIWEFQNDNADTVFTTMSVCFPVLGILFILILDD